MTILAIVRRWIEVLAAVLFTLHEAWRAKHSLTVSLEEERLTIRQGSDRESVLAVAPLGTPVSEEVARIARKGLVVLVLSPDKVATRTISVPSQAQEFLAGIVRNQIERLSPWQSDQTVFGFDAKTNQEDAATLDVRVLITSRTVIDGARNQVTSIGLPVDRVVVREHGEPSTNQSVLLWSRVANVAHDEVRRANWQIGAAIAACTAVSIAISLWALVSAS